MVTGEEGERERAATIERGFRWKGRDGSFNLSVEYTPAEEYIMCHCERCRKVAQVTDEENVLRVGRFCAAMIIEATSDLFLMEKERPPKAGPEPSDESVLEEPALKVIITESRIQTAAQALLGKLHKLHGNKRTETLAAMRDAYEWIFADNKSIFRGIYDEKGCLVEAAEGNVEVCIPFLVAAEAANIDAEWFRGRIYHFMKVAGLTRDMLKRGLCQMSPDRIANSESKIDRWFRTGQKRAKSKRIEVASDPVKVAASVSKVEQWFRALKEKRKIPHEPWPGAGGEAL